MDGLEITLTNTEMATLLAVVDQALFETIKNFNQEERHMRMMGKYDAVSSAYHAKITDILEHRISDLKGIKHKAIASKKMKNSDQEVG